jgi:hypothetical protein
VFVQKENLVVDALETIVVERVQVFRGLTGNSRSKDDSADVTRKKSNKSTRDQSTQQEKRVEPKATASKRNEGERKKTTFDGQRDF